jgi:hypothetical protein
MVYREWHQTDFVDHLGAFLAKKDHKYLTGGPYDLYTVVVYTNEPWSTVPTASVGYPATPWGRIRGSRRLTCFTSTNQVKATRTSASHCVNGRGDSPAGCASFAR